MDRKAGILFPMFSLASKYGIGSLSKEAYAFVDFLNRSGQGFWQLLPVGPTGYGNSPYQPLSAFAGNPYFISFEGLEEEGWLEKGEADQLFWGESLSSVDYGAMFENRPLVLRKAFKGFRESLEKDADLKKSFRAFVKKQDYWLQDYALFMAIKDERRGECWLDWDKPLKLRDKQALSRAGARLKEEVDYHIFLQFAFDRQWSAFKGYANEKGVRIIGDIPFYVSLDSADAWSRPEVFLMDKDRTPRAVAGCPPDAFSADGQLWGNPLYDWEALKADDYSWWIRRMSRNYELFDVIRVDHFHGFCEYYAVPYGEENARRGEMKKGPGMDFFRLLNKRLKNPPIIAEDLGTNTPEKEALLKDTGYPGMKVLQYAFTSWDSCYLNHRHEKNCVVYTGTHDNTPSIAWFREIRDGERSFVREYINSHHSDEGAFVWDFIREAYRSVADLCIIPLQDYLCMGKEARLNTPGTFDGNWQWRLLPDFLSGELEHSIRRLSEVYGRI